MKRRILIPILLVPVAAVAVLAGAVFMIPEARIAAFASERAEAILGREVRIGRVGIDLFPRPAVVLDELAIAGADSADTPLATVRRVGLRPKLLPLLARRVVIDEISLERPRLLVTFNADGGSNLPTLATDTTGHSESGSDAAGGDIAFLIDRFEIIDGRLGYTDDRTGTAIRLDGINQRLRLSGQLSGGALTRIGLDGELNVDAIGALMPGKLAVPIRDLRLRVEHRAMLDLAGDSLALDYLAVRLQELALEGRGSVHDALAGEVRQVALRLAAGPVDMGALTRSLPKELFERMMPETGGLPDVGGTASIRVMADGALGGGVLPEVAGVVELDGVRVALDGRADVLNELGGTIDFSLQTISTEGLEGRLLGQPLYVAFTVQDPAAPVADVKLRAGLDLRRATDAGLLADSLGARGIVEADLAIQAPVLTPSTGTVDGVVRLSEVAARPPTLLVPAEVPSGRITFRGRRLDTERLQVHLGESDLTLDFAAEEWLPLALGHENPSTRITLDARSRKLDLNTILEQKDESVKYSELLFARLADRPIDGRPAGEVAAEAGFRMPPLPPVALQGRFRADALYMNDLEFQSLDVAFGGTGERIEVTDAKFQLMGGGIQVAGRVGLSAGNASEATGGEVAGFPAVVSYQLRDVGAAPFFDRLTPFRDHLSGSLLLAGTAQLVLDENLLPIRESVAAAGNIAIRDGQLTNWPVARALGEKLGLAAFDTLTLRDWAGEFQITGPRITLRESVFESKDLAVRAAGAFDFSGELDLAATLRLSPELASRIRSDLASRLTSLTADDDGRVPIGLRITGPATSPDIQLDFSRAAENAIAEARQAAENRARELAEDVVKQAASKLLPDDSIATRPDSARARLESELKSRLRRLIPIKN